MKTATLLIILTCLFATNSFSEKLNWQRINPINSEFSFAFPGSPTILSESEKSTMYDGVLGDKSFIHFIRQRLDSTFQFYLDSVIQNTEGYDSTFEVNHSDALDTLRNPIYSYKTAFTNNYEGFILLNFDTLSLVNDASVSGGHISFSTINSGVTTYIFIRILIKGKEIYCFSVESDTSNYSEANLAKEQYFNSILLLTN